MGKNFASKYERRTRRLHKKLQAEEKRLSFESELEQYERIILSDIQQLEMVYANLENWDKAYSLINNVDF